MVSAGNNTIIFKDDTTAITGAMTVTKGSGIGGDHDFTPIVLTANKAFNVTTSASVQLSGYVIYIAEA